MRSDLSDANLDGADLPHACLVRAKLIGTSVEQANFGQAWVYGAAIWDLRGRPAHEGWLSITPDGDRYFDPSSLQLRVNGLEMAQFLYSMATRRANRPPGTALGGLLESLSSLTVLLLGRFTDERKAILESIEAALTRGRSLCPILFDFDRPATRDLTETVRFLAGASRFIIADLTDPSSIPHELMAIVPSTPSVPVIPIIAAGRQPYAMFEHLRRYPWVLGTCEYRDEKDLLDKLPELLERANRRLPA